MNILHVIAGMDPKLGGVCQGLRTIATGLEEEGMHNEVITMDVPGASFFATDNFKIHAIGPGKGAWCYNPKLIPWLIENLQSFDTVIIHGIWLYHDYAVQKAVRYLKRQKTAKETKIPKVFVFPQGMLDPYFQQASGRRLKALRNWAYWKLVEGKVINEADGLLFTAETERQLAHVPFSPYYPKSESVVGMGVEPPPACSSGLRNAFLQKCPEVQSSPYILFLSRIHEKKGVDLLVEAYANAMRVIGSTEELPKLVIAGPGLETLYGRKIQQFVSNSEVIKSSVFFPGMLEGEAKWGAFYGCEAFALTTHQENFGIAIAEALACSKPVLISNKTNIWREIESSGGGLVADDTKEGVNNMLLTWLALSKEEKSGFSQRAYETYNSHFAIKPTIKRWITSLQ